MSVENAAWRARNALSRTVRPDVMCRRSGRGMHLGISLPPALRLPRPSSPHPRRGRLGRSGLARSLVPILSISSSHFRPAPINAICEGARPLQSLSCMVKPSRIPVIVPPRYRGCFGRSLQLLPVLQPGTFPRWLARQSHASQRRPCHVGRCRLRSRPASTFDPRPPPVASDVRSAQASLELGP